MNSSFLFMFFLIGFQAFLYMSFEFKKALNVLILMEYFSLNIFFILSFFLMKEFGLNFLMYFLVILVCEGAMGLSVLVSLVRFNTKFSLNSMSFLLC
uniref:NADH dehydrogenase subunit 4L n=1 Tax=Opimothrips tubulatus TaxID=2724111 RepID=A0A9E9IZJ3_9NEOP|nr:NADH dehydrogenase subunit 4L [Opimothrips tubulatus]WAO28730.1 NADH dehydrogenase subunit 4L [Opimothrips tubulatus]